MKWIHSWKKKKKALSRSVNMKDIQMLMKTSPPLQTQTTNGFAGEFLHF